MNIKDLHTFANVPQWDANCTLCMLVSTGVSVNHALYAKLFTSAPCSTSLVRWAMCEQQYYLPLKRWCVALDCHTETVINVKDLHTSINVVQSPMHEWHLCVLTDILLKCGSIKMLWKEQRKAVVDCKRSYSNNLQYIGGGSASSG